MNAWRSSESLRVKKPRIDEEKRILRHSLGSGATPLSTTNLPEVSRRQDTVQIELRKRITRQLRGRSPLIRDFAEYNFLGRFARRLDRNRASYDTRLETEIPPALQEDHDRVLIGDGTVEQALKVMTGLKMPSIELARLTHPNTDMATNDQLHEMRVATHDAIGALGGAVHDEPDTAYELSNIDTIVPCGTVDETGRPVENAAVREGIMVTAKRHIGTLPDDVLVMERTSYIIDLNELPMEIADAIRSVNTLETPDPLRAIATAAQLDELIPYLVEYSDEEKSVIPMSTTIYAYNPLVVKVLEESIVLGKSDAPSDAMLRVRAAFAEDVKHLAGMWHMSTEQVHDDLTRRGLNPCAVQATLPEGDE